MLFSLFLRSRQRQFLIEGKFRENHKRCQSQFFCLQIQNFILLNILGIVYERNFYAAEALNWTGTSDGLRESQFGTYKNFTGQVCESTFLKIIKRNSF